jgi:preprotein translocase subunit SecB
VALDATIHDLIQVAAVPRHEPGGTVQTQTTVRLEIGADDLHWQVGLEVRVDGNQTPAPPYSIHIASRAQVRVSDPPTDPAETARIVGITGAGLLYSAVREMVLLLTSRGQFGPFMIPAMNFSALDWDVVKGEKAERTRRAKAKRVAKRAKRKMK